jgi:hypothetical protein
VEGSLVFTALMKQKMSTSETDRVIYIFVRLGKREHPPPPPGAPAAKLPWMQAIIWDRMQLLVQSKRGFEVYMILRLEARARSARMAVEVFVAAQTCEIIDEAMVVFRHRPQRSFNPRIPQRYHTRVFSFLFTSNNNGNVSVASG